jgi:gluconolactonase
LDHEHSNATRTARGACLLLCRADSYNVAVLDINPLSGDDAMKYLWVGVCLFATASLGQAQVTGIGKVGEVKKLHTGFDFTEGPAVDTEGNVYFSDIPKAKIYKIDLAGALSVFTDKSNTSNGLMLSGKGELVACEMEGAIAIWDVAKKERRVLTGNYKDNRYNAPNDLVIDKSGGVYFTDPIFRAPKPAPQDKTSVYYVTAKGDVTRLVDNLPNPNGVRLSPDEKTLYVIPSGQAEMMAYPVEAPGKIGVGKVFCTLKQADGKKGGGGDGLTVDSKGNVYITSAIGLQVYDPSGNMLGNIAFPEQPSNATFGGADLKTLFVTARTSVYTVPMEMTGHRFPGK